MFRWRSLSSVLLTVLFTCQSFGAEILLNPSPPKRGEAVEFNLDIAPDDSTLKWTVEREFEENITAVSVVDGSSNKNKIAILEPGEYFVTADFKVGGVAKKIRRQFVIQTAEETKKAEDSKAADDQFSNSRITQNSVSVYLKAKIPGDTDSPLTALLMANKLKSILNDTRDVTDKDLIYKALREGAAEVIDTRTKDILETVYPGSTTSGFAPNMVEKKLIDDLNARFQAWIDATDHLITRLEQTVKDAAELRMVLNEAVLPALGGESIPLQEREPETPVPPLNADTLIRLLQQNRGGTTTVPTSSRRSKRCCIGILLGP